ncbi:unnamed protein product [Prunus armeniaca]
MVHSPAAPLRIPQSSPLRTSLADVDAGQREAVLWAGFVQIGVVLAHSPSALCPQNNYRVGQTYWVRGLPDEAYGHELVNFVLHGFVSFGIVRSTLLPDRFKGGRNSQLVADDFRGYARHVIVGPSKDLRVLPKEMDELGPEGGIWHGTDLHTPVLPAFIQCYGF